MDYTQFATVLVEQKIGPLVLSHMVAADRARFPQMTDAQLAAQVTGDAWHLLRRYLGFLVDVLRAVPQVSAVFAGAVAAAIGQPTADLSGLLAAIPNAPAVAGPTAATAGPTQAQAGNQAPGSQQGG